MAGFHDLQTLTISTVCNTRNRHDKTMHHFAQALGIRPCQVEGRRQEKAHQCQRGGSRGCCFFADELKDMDPIPTDHSEKLDYLGESSDVFLRRFWLKVESRGACWEWTASKLRSGYGEISVRGIPRVAHRVAWELFFGELPRGALLLHSCGSKACVNPAHMFLGDFQDNLRVMVSASRGTSRRPLMQHFPGRETGGFRIWV